MILIFLGSMRATLAVFFSIPLSALAAFIAISMGGGSINSMVLGGLALAFSRLIDNSVVVLENIYRHLEAGESPAVAAERASALTGSRICRAAARPNSPLRRRASPRRSQSTRATPAQPPGSQYAELWRIDSRQLPHRAAALAAPRPTAYPADAANQLRAR